MASAARRGGRSRQRRRGSPTSEQEDLAASMGRLSIQVQGTSKIRVPPISAYAMGKPAVAAAGEAVAVGEAIPKARAIPDSFPSPSEYLKVRTAGGANIVDTGMYPRV